MPVIVMAMLLRGTDVLLARRSPHRAAHSNLWSFPGGHLENNEDRESALRREVLEEIGITPLEHVLVSRLPGSIAEDSVVFELHAVRKWSGNPEIRDGEHTELRWFDLSEAATLPALALEEFRPLLAALHRGGPEAFLER